jgi:hypothetical protein
MAVTPLIKPIQNKKGILYNFQSSIEDIQLNLTNNPNGVRYSKFALIRLPEIGTPDTLATDNKIQFLAPGESPIIEGLNPDNNINLAESFQNYALNLEALLVSQDEYNYENKLTVAERVFFKWAKELGSIRFKDANNLQKNLNTLGTEKRFVEPDDPTSTYKRMVQYVADIDVVNSIRSADNAYTEIFLHVPTNVGTTPYVLFKSVKDENYYPNQTITNNPPDPLDIEYLKGRHFDEINPFGLSLKAFYDKDDGSVNTEITDDPTNPASLIPGNWYTELTNNSYFTDDYNSTGEYDVSEDQLIRKQFGSTSVEYVRNTLDGICIDFNLQNYKLAAENQEIKAFTQLNDYVNNKNFEYNAILIYYDVFDPNNLDSEGNPIDPKTNLYGVLFLDKIEQEGLEFIIPPITKYMPDPLNGTNGNAFSHKPNLKLDTSVENVLVEKSINDYSTFSMDLFLDVLTQFKQLQVMYNDKLLELNSLQTEVDNLKDLLLNQEDLNELGIRVSNLETSLTANQALFNNTNAVVEMIESVNGRVNDIISGNTSIEVSYNLDVIKAGPGITLDKSIPNRLKIINSNQEYNIENNSITNVFTNNNIKLGKYTNYIKHENGGLGISLSKDLELFINDTDTSWSKGQSLELLFEDSLDVNIYSVKIYTDATNKIGLGPFGKNIINLTDIDFEPDDRPILKITCIDDALLQFKVDKIR